jgi:hypothetical protein
MSLRDYSDLWATAPYLQEEEGEGVLDRFFDERVWAPLTPITPLTPLASSSSSALYSDDAVAVVVESGCQREPPLPPQPPQEPVYIEDEPDVYTVECILKHKNRPAGRTYYVKWEGWDSRYNSWIKRSDFITDDLPAAYEQALCEDREEARRRRRAQQPQPRRKRTFHTAAAAATTTRFERACKRQRRQA